MSLARATLSRCETSSDPESSVDYCDVDGPMPYCPRCEAPWSEHEIEVAPELADEPRPVYWLQRRGGPTDDCPDTGDDILGSSRREAEHHLARLADAESCRALWQDYSKRYRSRELLDALAARGNRRPRP